MADKKILDRHYQRLDGLRALRDTVLEQDVYDPQSIRNLERKIAHEQKLIINMAGECVEERTE